MKGKDTIIILAVLAAAIGLGISRSIREESRKTETIIVTKIETEAESSTSFQTTVAANVSTQTRGKSQKSTKSSENYENIRVNINSADRETLVKLNGIGDKLADEIIEYRNENGKFKNIEEILNVPGVGEKIFNLIKDNIYVENSIYDSEEDFKIYININTATHDDLVKLYKIGDSLADEIIKYREANGSFNNIEEIMKVPGISEGIFSFIRENIYVENPFYYEEITNIPETQAEEPIESPYCEPETISPLTLEDVSPIELNSADLELLKLLPHIGDEEAADIIALRNEIVGFSNVYELLYVESLTDEQVIDILPYVYVA